MKMEAVAAVGLAANIGQFCVYALDVIGRSREIFAAMQNEGAPNHELRLYENHIQRLKLSASLGTRRCDEALETLYDDSIATGEELLVLFAKCSGGAGGRLSSLKMAAKSLHLEPRVKTLKERLEYIDRRVQCLRMAQIREVVQDHG